MVDVSVVVVNWNTRDLLAQCLDSIYGAVGSLSAQVIVVDNGSADGSVEMVRQKYPQACAIANTENVGFVRANNQAMAQCQGRYILLLNSDTLVLPGSLEATVAFMDAHPDAGLAGIRLLHADGTFQASYTLFPTLWQEFLILTRLGRWLIRPYFPSRGPEIERGAQEIRGYVEGAYIMARREAVERVGGFDEHIFMYAEDVDWCYRFYQAGWPVWYLPQVSIIHYGGQSSGKRRGRMEAELYRSRVHFFYKHYGKASGLCLKLLIYGLTLCKMALHGAIRLVTRGRKGRSVTSWRELCLALGDVGSVLEQRTKL